MTDLSGVGDVFVRGVIFVGVTDLSGVLNENNDVLPARYSTFTTPSSTAVLMCL